MSLTIYLCGHLLIFEILLENNHMNNTTNDTNMTGNADNGRELRTNCGQEEQIARITAAIEKAAEVYRSEKGYTGRSVHKPDFWIALADAALKEISLIPNAKNITERLVDRFLSWRLPETVCADLCATTPQAGRYGTNLLSASEAKQMIEHLLPMFPEPPLYQIDKDGILRPLEHSSATAELERDEVARITIRSCPETFVASREWLQEMIERNNGQIDQLAERDERLRKLANAADVLWEEHKAFSLECNGAEGMDQFGSDSAGHNMMQSLVDETVAAVKGGAE